MHGSDRCLIPMGNWSKVKEDAFAALNSPTMKYIGGVMLVYGALGSVTLLEGELDTAEKYLLKAYAAEQDFMLEPDATSNTNVSYIDCPLGQLYMIKRDFPRAEKYLHDVYSRLKKRGLYLDNVLAMAITLSLMVEISEKQKDNRMHYLILTN